MCDYNDDNWLPDAPHARIVDGIDLRSLASGKDVQFSITENVPIFRETEQWEKTSDSDCEESEFYDFVTQRDTRILPIDRDFESVAKTMVNVDEEGFVKKEILKPGHGEIVKPSSFVVVHYQFFLDGVDEPFDSTRLRKRHCHFQLGEGQQIEGLEIAVSSMRVKELSRFLLSWQVAFGRLGAPPRIPPEADIVADIELLEVVDGPKGEKGFDHYMKQAKVKHLLGNEQFKRNQYKDAVRSYREALKIVDNMRLANADEEKAMVERKVKLLVNLARCYDKLNKPQQSCVQCREALSLDPRNVKAYFYFGRANLKLSNFNEAASFLKKALKLQPTSKEIIDELKKVAEKKMDAEEREVAFCRKSVGANTTDPEKIKAEEKRSEMGLRLLLKEKLVEKKNLPFIMRGKITATERIVCEEIAREYDVNVNFGFYETTFGPL